jgi:hypothetical protein
MSVVTLFVVFPQHTLSYHWSMDVTCNTHYPFAIYSFPSNHLIQERIKISAILICRQCISNKKGKLSLEKDTCTYTAETNLALMI